MAKRTPTKKTAKKARTTKAKAKKPAAPSSPDGPLELGRDRGRIYSPIRDKWLVETPEELVRQAFLPILVNEYGYTLDQIAEEQNLTGKGTANARADFVIWRTTKDRQDGARPLIIVECKSDHVTITPADYGQGDAYARIVDAPFVLTHNSRETKFWRVRKDKMPGYLEEIENIPHANASDKDIEELLKRLKTFKEDEFADLLHQCHNVIRNREHLDPTAAFDEIAKVLFVKTWVEREMKEKKKRQNIFSVEFLDEQIGKHPIDTLFQETKAAFAADQIFADDDRINLKYDTAREIVRRLERYNLSDTSEDVKGIAFERFLGRTFRGEIGQFFTPRPVVEFMIRMVEPKEGEVICDPASGSGGFLIRFFEIVREQILRDINREYTDFVESLEKKKLSEAKRAELLREKDEERRNAIDQRTKGTRLWHLANRCIYGCDANDRMARTSKMNMIMHGDGHGGVHHHNGFINVNGIFEGRFDIILTNPPFGSNVEPTDRITEGDLRTTDEQQDRYRKAYGEKYTESQERIRRALNARAPIASLFELPKRAGSSRKLGKIKTEILFIERCLNLLKPGGRLGVVLPEGIFNNPSLQYVREFTEDRARILAVVSLPQDAFSAAGASVKASLLFLQKFTEEEAQEFDAIRDEALTEVENKYAPEIEAETDRLEAEIDAAKKAKDADRRKAAQAELKAFTKRIEDQKTTEARELLRERFNYPVFLYDAERVGISATGEQDVCELHHDPVLGLSAGMTEADTALELYRRFREDPASFAVAEAGA